MAKQTYKALANVSIAGVKREKGDTFEAESKSAHVQTALHFKQIAETSEKEAAADAKSKAKAKADAEAEAAAKAKAAADAK